MPFLNIRAFAIVLACVFLNPAAAIAQKAASKPYREGPVWDIAFVRVKYGMEDKYLRYLADEWKREHEAMKKAGYVLDFKVLVTEPHDEKDYNVILLTEFKDMASLESEAHKRDALREKLFGGAKGVENGNEERMDYREILGTRLSREIILEPKPTSPR